MERHRNRNRNRLRGRALLSKSAKRVGVTAMAMESLTDDTMDRQMSSLMSMSKISPELLVSAGLAEEEETPTPTPQAEDGEDNPILGALFGATKEGCEVRPAAAVDAKANPGRKLPVLHEEPAGGGGGGSDGVLIADREVDSDSSDEAELATESLEELSKDIVASIKAPYDAESSTAGPKGMKKTTSAPSTPDRWGEVRPSEAALRAAQSVGNMPK